MTRRFPITVGAEELAEMVQLSGKEADLPGDRAGWAFLDLNGKTYRAWLCAPIRRGGAA